MVWIKHEKISKYKCKNDAINDKNDIDILIHIILSLMPTFGLKPFFLLKIKDLKKNFINLLCLMLNFKFFKC